MDEKRNEGSLEIKWIIEERLNQKLREGKKEMKKVRCAGIEADVGGGSREESVEEGCEDGAKLN